ncbi:YrhK family protein [Modicisalibacter coralii]|uniref:YrhK family protein n=1 Tax=Modicisalibacter coralii TaxID=2304602 RepID=UPI00100AFD85|nr:YrhK family protein [Halomonas coralii]
MPHLFTNRAKLSDLTRETPDPRDDFRWETANAILYKIGGFLFIVGSVFFFPRFEAYQNIGAWVFFVGSLLYLVVTGHDMLEVRKYWRQRSHHAPGRRLEMLAASSYLTGTVLFTVGSLFFLSWWGWFTAGAWCFVIGSLLFVLGASVNVLRIVQAPSLLSMQMTNLTAVAFVVGSVLFAIASIPYLWTFDDPASKLRLFTFLAWQYLIGSLLFFLGGVFNYYRAYLLMARHRDGESRHAGDDALLMAYLRGEISAAEFRHAWRAEGLASRGMP